MRRVLGWPQILQRVTGSSLKFAFFLITRAPGNLGDFHAWYTHRPISSRAVWILMKIYPSSLEGSLKAPSQVSSILLGTVLVTRERLYSPFVCSTLQEVDQLTCSNHQDITPEVEFLAGSSRTLVMRKPRSTGGSSAGGSSSAIRSLGGMLGWEGASRGRSPFSGILRKRSSSNLRIHGGFPNIRGTILGGPDDKVIRILGSILGPPYFGKLPHLHMYRDLSSGHPPRQLGETPIQRRSLRLRNLLQAYFMMRLGHCQYVVNILTLVDSSVHLRPLYSE